MWGTRIRRSAKHTGLGTNGRYSLIETEKTLERLQKKMANYKERRQGIPAGGISLKLLDQKILGVQYKIQRLMDFHRNVQASLSEITKKSTEEETFVVQQAEVVTQNYSQNQQSTPVFINTNSCVVCQSTLQIRTHEASAVCPECATSHTILSDNHELSSSIHRKTLNSKYNRAPLYRKFLTQFHEDVEPPPQEVISRLYWHLNKVHIMLPMKVKPTPVCQILRKEGYQAWCYMSIRITKIMNREPIVTFTTPIIEKLLYRFDKVSGVYQKLKAQDRKKILNFEYLTRHFLMMDGLPEKAMMFNLHKTKAVLSNADYSFSRCCQHLQEHDTEHNWKYVRSY